MVGYWNRSRRFAIIPALSVELETVKKDSGMAASVTVGIKVDGKPRRAIVRAAPCAGRGWAVGRSSVGIVTSSQEQATTAYLRTQASVGGAERRRVEFGSCEREGGPQC